MSEAVAVVRSDDVNTSFWVPELVKISDRLVSCVRMLTGVAMSELITEELVSAAPSTTLALIVSIKLVALSITKADTRLEGTSVAAGKVKMSVMPSDSTTCRVDVSDCESKVIDATSVASEMALVGAESDTTMALLDATEIREEPS